MKIFDRSKRLNEVLVFGKAAADRMKGIISEFEGLLSLKIVHSTDQLISKLKRHKQSICILEHDVSLMSMKEQFSKLIWCGKSGHTKYKIENDSSSQPIQAYDILPKLIEISPETNYIIVSHMKGSGVTPKEKERYKKYPQVLKVMGFINSKTNVQYLFKLLNTKYLQ